MENSTKAINKIRNVYISLPDDYEELSSMMRYEEEWFTFLIRYIYMRCTSSFGKWYRNDSSEESFDYAFNRMCYPNEIKLDLKQYLKRRLNTLNTCGGFSMNETQFVENDKRAIKKSCKKILRLLNLKHY